jgi:hypothetical protein
MFRTRGILLGLLVIVSFLSGSVGVTGSGTVRQRVGSEDVPRTLTRTTPVSAPLRPALDAISQPPAALTPPAGRSEVQVTLSAAHSTTSWDARDTERQTFDLPLLYLRREREATAVVDRTLAIRIAGLPAAAEIQIQVISRRVDISTAIRHRETRSYRLPDRPCTSEHPCTIPWTFDASTTPSDLYTLRVQDPAGDTLWKSPHPDRPDFALLDTWDVQVGSAQNRPYTVRVYYGTLFPFAKGQKDFDNRLPPNDVTDFIEHEFAPIIQETWRTQLQDWGFGDPIHPDWDPDQLVEIFITDPPFALFDGTGTYSRFNSTGGRLYPERRIWWFSSNNAFEAYDSLQNGYKMLFAHEFFHLAQWNVLLLSGNPTNYALNLFIEAQGKFAPSVQYPELELSRDHVVSSDSTYGRAANRFLTLRLNGSYKEMEAESVHKYDLTLYWRFLYEQYRDMEIIRVALEEMACHYTPDIVTSVGDVMDSAFARVDGPFRTYEESLVAFARANYALANYALRLESGRCAVLDQAECAGLYHDPQDVYATPPLEAQLDYDGIGLTERGFTRTSSGMEPAGLSGSNTVRGEPDAVGALAYGGAIPASYGMDFIEVYLDPALYGQPLTVRFQGAGAVARFNVQVWKLAPGPWKPGAVIEQPAVMARTAGGAQVYTIPSLDTETYDRLVLIITRVDANEATDPNGNYRVVLDMVARLQGRGNGNSRYA